MARERNLSQPGRLHPRSLIVARAASRISLVLHNQPPRYSNHQSRGGGLYNGGGVADFYGGSLFDGNSADSSSDGGSGGAIYNGDEGVVT